MQEKIVKGFIFMPVPADLFMVSGIEPLSLLRYSASEGRIVIEVMDEMCIRDRISIIIPCHRVVGSNGSLIGYAGGIQRKKYLLEHEKADMSKLFVPVKGTAI